MIKKLYVNARSKVTESKDHKFKIGISVQRRSEEENSEVEGETLCKGIHAETRNRLKGSLRLKPLEQFMLFTTIFSFLELFYKSIAFALQELFNILNLGRINARILYKETTGEKISRQEFLFQLAEELGSEYQKE